METEGTTTPVSPSESWRTTATCSVLCWWHLWASERSPPHPREPLSWDTAWKRWPLQMCCGTQGRNGEARRGNRLLLAKWQLWGQQVSLRETRGSNEAVPVQVDPAWTLESGGHTFMTLLRIFWVATYMSFLSSLNLSFFICNTEITIPITQCY